jgi:hypothetical protein
MFPTAAPQPTQRVPEVGPGGALGLGRAAETAPRGGTRAPLTGSPALASARHDTFVN